MILCYPAKIKYLKDDKSYMVEFPDLPGCLTEENSLEDAKSNAKDVTVNELCICASMYFILDLQCLLDSNHF